jgi:hypothetical protein
MPQSYKEYTGSALTATTFSVPFKYLSINDVNAIGFDGEKWSALALHSSTPRDAVNKTITLAAAPNTLYSILRLYRATSTTQLIDFQNGSRLSESDLDAAYQQSLFVAQEISEDASTTQFRVVRESAVAAGTSLSNFASQAFTGDGSTKVFTLTAFAPQTEGAEAYRVSIDGVMQSPIDAYTISMSPAQITFLGTVAPPTGSKIVVVTAASAASAVSVDDVTLGLTSANKVQVKDGGITPDKLSTGAPRWATTNDSGQLFVDGAPNSSGESVAGIELNSNISSGDGYAFIDFHSKSATNPNYDSRISNSSGGNLILQNNTAAADIYLQTTDSSGNINTAVQIDDSSNLRVRGDITGHDNFGRTAIYGGTSGHGANIELYAGSHLTASNRAVYDASEHDFRTQSGGNGTIVDVKGNIYYTGSITDTSDRRLKEDVNDLSGSLDKITQLNGKSYVMIDDERGQTEFGFIAQEVKEVFPEVVKEIQQYELDENGEETTEEVNYIGVSYVQLIAPMVEAIKELKSKNETLEARIESLENA